jgi:hypothetical protein
MLDPLDIMYMNGMFPMTNDILYIRPQSLEQSRLASDATCVEFDKQCMYYSLKHKMISGI